MTMTVHWNQFVSSLNCECDVNVAWNFREDTVAAGPTCVVAFSLFYFKPQLWTFQVIHASLTIAIFIHVTKQTKSTSLNYDFQHCENDFSAVYGNCMCWVKLSSFLREISSIMIFVGKSPNFTSTYCIRRPI